MPFPELMAAVARLNTATETLAAIGAQLDLAQRGVEADPRVAAAYAAVSDAAGVGDLSDLTPEQRAMALGFIRVFFREAELLLADPARPPVWNVTDPMVLEGWGRGSAMIPGAIADALPPGLTSFLDVGVGVGWLAISAARMWPDATIVGVDVWEPSLERARKHVADEGLDGRVLLRHQDARDLDDVEAFDAVWLPSFFFDAEALPVVVGRVAAAVRPGGVVVLGRFVTRGDPAGDAVNNMRTVLSGGYQIDEADAVALLEGAGLAAVAPIAPKGPVPLQFLAGTRA